MYLQTTYLLFLINDIAEKKDLRSVVHPTQLYRFSYTSFGIGIIQIGHGLRMRSAYCHRRIFCFLNASTPPELPKLQMALLPINCVRASCPAKLHQKQQMKLFIILPCHLQMSNIHLQFAPMLTQIDACDIIRLNILKVVESLFRLSITNERHNSAFITIY